MYAKKTTKDSFTRQSRAAVRARGVGRTVTECTANSACV